MQRSGRFHYSLRTLFVLLTLASVAAWGLWNWRCVRERQWLIEGLNARGVMFGRVIEAEPEGRVPWGWKALGATPVGLIEVPPDLLAEEELRRLSVWFPEATIRTGPNRTDHPFEINRLDVPMDPVRF